MKIKKGDQVKILSGKDRGKMGKVLIAYPKEGKITVEGVNILTRHRRSRKQGQKGEKVQVSMPFDASNVLLVCGSCKKPTRAGFKIIDSGKIRICKKCASPI